MTVDKARIARAVREILEAVGEDPEREGLRETPRRVADAYEELLGGIGRDPARELVAQFTAPLDELVIVRDVRFASLCEHHLLPFYGVAHVGYLPNGCILGMSKVARLIDVLAKRPQVQERLTTEIADAMNQALHPRGVGVVLEAEHLCLSIRGARRPGARLVTSATRGAIHDDAATRAEFWRLVGVDNGHAL
jgi:GTP cyclohydrolase I